MYLQKEEKKLIGKLNNLTGDESLAEVNGYLQELAMISQEKAQLLYLRTHTFIKDTNKVKLEDLTIGKG